MPDTKNNVVTRFAPSPTGYLHLGNYRTALFSYLFARQQNGKFILRIEDTDKERSKEEYTKDIIESLAWMNLPYEETFFQSKRMDIHKAYLKKLIDEGKAYISKETPKEKGQRDEVIRFKNPNKVVTFTDIIRGEVSMDTSDLGDFIIAKSLEEPVFHIAVVVDDFEMGVTHIVRGEDHISNTPRHILIQEAIGAPRPVYAHLPMVLAPDRSKLSKRKGALSVKDCRDMGYLPEAIVNMLALIGWNPGTEQELFSLEELVSVFDLSRVQKSGAIFNIEKLNFINKEYIRKLPAEEIISHIEKAIPHYSDKKDRLLKLVPIVIDRIEKLSDIKTMAEEGELSYFFETPDYEVSKLAWKGDSPHLTKEHLAHVATLIHNIDESHFTADNVKTALWDYATEKGKGNVLWPLRMSLSGKDKSPDPFTLASILGKHEVLARIEHALKKLN